jgi:hypothetical protein
MSVKVTYLLQCHSKLHTYYNVIQGYILITMSFKVTYLLQCQSKMLSLLYRPSLISALRWRRGRDRMVVSAYHQ